MIENSGDRYLPTYLAQRERKSVCAYERERESKKKRESKRE